MSDTNIITVLLIGIAVGNVLTLLTIGVYAKVLWDVPDDDET